MPESRYDLLIRQAAMATKTKILLESTNTVVAADLTVAIQSGEVELVKNVICRLQNSVFGSEALDASLKMSKLMDVEEVVPLLLNAGATPSAKSILHAIVFEASPQSDRETLSIMRQLFGAKQTANLDVNAIDDDFYGGTPLHICSHLEHLHTVKFLLDNGADVNARDKKSMQPAHYLTHARFNAEDNEEDNGEDSGEDNVEKWSSQKQDILDLLLKHGADLAAKDEGGRTVASFLMQYLTPQQRLARVLKNFAADDGFLLV